MTILRVHTYIVKGYKFIIRKSIMQYWRMRTKWFYRHLGVDSLIDSVQRMPQNLIVETLKFYGAKIGNEVNIERGLVLHRAKQKNPFSNLIIEDGSFIGRRVFIDLADEVLISQNSAIGADCMIWTHVGDYTKKLYHGDYKEKLGKVIIKESTICYARCIIGQGVTVGSYSRVGAGSVVLGDIPDRELFAGNPAKHIKYL